MELVERNGFELVGLPDATADELRARLGVPDATVVELREGHDLFVGVQVDPGTHAPEGMEARLVDIARWVRATGEPFERLETWAIDHGHEPEDVTLAIGDERWVRLRR